MRRGVPRISRFHPGGLGKWFAVRRTVSLIVAILLFSGGLWSGWGLQAASADDTDIVLYVTMEGDDTNGGTGWDDAFATLQKALDAADTSGGQAYQIWIAKGTYIPTHTLPASSVCVERIPDPPNPPESWQCVRYEMQVDPQTAHFAMKNDVAIYGGFAGTEDPASFSLAERDFANNETILSGDLGVDPVSYNHLSAYHVFYHPNLALDATAVLDGVTISGGRGVEHQGYGGGMYNIGSSPALTHVTFSGNYAQYAGGAMANDSSNPTLTHVTISGNEARSGGGMYNAGGSSPILTHVTISDNEAFIDEGGGMANRSGSSPDLTYVTISGNEANIGGGMYNSDSSPTLTNVTISGNKAKDISFGGKVGGGIYSHNGSLTLTHVTISGNWADYEAGGIYNNNSATTISNSIIWGNSTTDGYNPNIVISPYWSTFPVISHSLIGYSNGSGDNWNASVGSDDGYNIDADPKFIDYQPATIDSTSSGDYRLRKDSPAINAGNIIDIPDGILTDLDGNIRVTGASVDMGAYEYERVLPVPRNLIGTAGDRQVTLSWDGVNFADSYEVYKYEGATGPVTTDDWERVASDINVTTYKVTELTNGTGYAFAVKAVSTLGDSDFPDAAIATPSDVPPDVEEEDGPDHILYVTMEGNDTNGGTSWDNAFATLQKALDTADTSGGQTYQIWIAKGTYIPTHTFPASLVCIRFDTDSPNPGGCMQTEMRVDPQTAHFAMKNDVAIYGGFAGTEDPENFLLADRDFANNETIISGYLGVDLSSYHVFYHQNLALDATAILDGVTISGGRGGYNGLGGGMFNDSSSPALTHVTFSGNEADFAGGGMANLNSSPTLTHVTFSGNSASRGGGMYNINSSPILTHVTIIDNNASMNEGGGMSNVSGSSPVLTDVTISGNQAATVGGGMYNSSSSPTLTNVIISGNQAATIGGGIYTHNGSLTLTHVTISGNWAADDAGGLYNNESATTISNSIISGNSATDESNHNIVIAPMGSTFPVISHSLIEYSNGSGDNWNASVGSDDGNNIDADPKFIDYQPAINDPTSNGDYRLRKDSPAINAGNNIDIPSGIITDLDGNSRVVGASVDMGAYEYERVLPVPHNLIGTAGDRQVTLSWDVVNFADSYEVYKHEGATGPVTTDDWELVASDINVTTYEVTELTNETSYAFAVKAVSTLGDSDFTDAAVATPSTVTDNILYVTMEGDDANGGTNWDDAFATLQKALDTADTSGGQTYQIWIAKGTYLPTKIIPGTKRVCLNPISDPPNPPRCSGYEFQDDSRTAYFAMKNHVAIYGGFEGTENPANFALADRDFVANETILSGEVDGPYMFPAFHVFYHDHLALDATAVLDGVTITRGGANEAGGGMYNVNSSPTLTNVIISNSIADQQGGIGGGGMYNLNSNPILTNVAFIGNQADHGAGMYNLNSSPTLTNVTFMNNVGKWGGGIHNDNSSPTLTNVTISGNRSDAGGGMYNNNSSPTLTNVTISGNDALSEGGGMYNSSVNSKPTIRNSIIWGNSAGSQGPNIHNYFGSPSYSYSLIEGTSISWHNIGNDQGNNIDADPKFIDYEPASPIVTTVGDYRLQKDSPAINAGNTGNIPNGVITDVDGNLRVMGASVDLGAYEYQRALPVPLNLTGTAGDRQVTLSWDAVTYTVSYTVYEYEGTTAPAASDGWIQVASDVTDTTYTVSGLTNGTSYSFAVKAVSLLGDSEFTDAVVVTPETVPGVPTSVSATAGNEQVEVSFNTPTNNGGSAITGYTVTAWEDGGAASAVETGTASPITVAGLTNGTAYTFTVRAMNDLGDSPESDPSDPVTPRTVPDAPTGVSVAAGNEQAVVSFTAPTNNGGSAITGYTVTVWEDGGATGIDATGAASPITVVGLTNGTAYTFTVRATNIAGNSPESASSDPATPLPSTPTAPGNLGGTAGDQQVNLNWDAVTGASSYTVYKYEGTTAPVNMDDWQQVAMNVTGTTYTVTDLTNGTSYAFAVMAVNLGGESGFSIAEVVTPRTVPDAPTGVSADTGNGQVNVSFTAPSNNGGSVITGYTVTAWVDGNATNLTSTGTTSPIILTGLTNGTAYTFTVLATNAAGDSPESAPSAQVTPLPPAPAAPASLGGTSGDQQVTLSWNAVTGANSYKVYKYEGTTAPVNMDDWQQVAMNVTGTTYTVTGLTKSTSYAFAVIAVNLGGDSGFSAAAVATPTAELPPDPDPDRDPASDPAPGPDPVAPTGSGNNGFVEPVISTNGSITILVGRSGEVSQDGAISIMIPGGAADRELRITIEKVLNTQDLLSDGETLISDIYELLKNFPESFNKPVTLSFVLDPSVAQSNQTIAVFYYNEAEKKWIKIGGEISGHNIRVEVDHFTKFAVFAADEAAAAPDPDEIAFSDISEHWAEDSIKQAVLDGIIAGYPDGTFRPEEPVSRAEFTVMLAHALKLDGTGATLSFTDWAEIGAWAEEAIARAVQAGIVNGYEDGRFRPNAPITRAEMALMIARALRLPTGATPQTGFSDDDRIPSWAKSAVEGLRRLGIVSGRGDGKYAPNDTATRAETVVTLLRMPESADRN